MPKAPREWPSEERYDVIQKGGKKGYRDRKTKTVLVPPKYDDAWTFSEGRGMVQMGNLRGFVDETGQEVIPPRYQYASDFYEGLAAVAFEPGPGKTLLWGYIAPDGHVAIEPQFKGASRFRENRAAICFVEEQLGYIDSGGKIVIPPTYAMAGEFYEGRAIVMKKVEEMGEFYGPEEIKFQKELFNRDMTGKRKKKTRYLRGFIDTEGNQITGFDYEYADQFNEGLAGVMKDGKYGYIDLAGILAISHQFLEASLFQEGEASVTVGEMVDGKYSLETYFGRIDRSGKFLRRWRWDHSAGRQVEF